MEGVGRDDGVRGSAVSSAPAPTVYALDEANAADVHLLGGKGASLVGMRALDLPVPPGFIVTTDVCHRYLEAATLPAGVWDDVLGHLARLEAELGRRFGDIEHPLLVSVRSGAPVSMPGMMDTILDLGLCASTVDGLAREAGAAFAWETYARLVRMFGTTVAGISGRDFEEARLDHHADRAAAPAREQAEAAQRLAEHYLQVYAQDTGREFPQEPLVQLREAVEAVFRSWNSPRAQRYRAYSGIAETLGTAVVVQAMVFGNLDDRSGTGVAFTRDPATGARGAYGDFLVRAQGEDVVAGEEDPADLDECRRVAPAAHAALCAAMPRLEHAYRDVCDIEFTVERGRLWVLQARRGQRTALAAVRIALDLVDEGLIDLDEAMRRIPPAALVRVLDPVLDPTAARTVLGRGLGASPGAAVGRVALSAHAAEELAAQGHSVVLVRPHTSPDDIAGFIAARGIVAARGGRTSHAAVVARGMDRPAVCGVHELRVSDTEAAFPGGTVHPGDELTIDGSLGEVYAGALPLVEPAEDPRVHALLERCDEHRRLPVITAGPPAPWADSMLEESGTARCRSAEELDAALDDDGVERILLDPAGAHDPAELLRAAQAVRDLDVDLVLLVDERWPASLRSLPRLPWKGVVAGPRGGWAARLLAAVIETGDGT